MKTPLLLTGLLIVTSAVVAGPKDPEVVAQEWNQSVEQSRQPLISSQNLVGQINDLNSVKRAIDAENSTPRISPKPREPLIDAPSYRIPKNLPNERPRGAVPWEYNGQTYWLVPLAPPAGK
jgi:hypothetical protein